MRISLGQLRRIIREEVMREAGRNYPHDPADEHEDFMGPDLPEEEFEPDNDNFFSHDSHLGAPNRPAGPPTYNPDGSRNKPSRSKFIPMRGR